MKTSLASVSISGSISEKLVAAQAAGFDGVEIFENDLLSAPETASELGRFMRELGLACSIFQPFRDYEGLPPDMRDRAIERMKRKFAVMEDLGTDLILLCSNCSPAATGDRARLLDDLCQIGEIAAAHGKRIAYEALAWGAHVNDHRDAWALVRDVDHPALGLCLDSFHSLARGIPSASIGDIRGDKLFMVQLADAPRLQMDYLNWSRHFRCMPGQGDLPLRDYAAAIDRIGYAGFWSLEIFNDRFRAGSATQIARDGKRSLLVLHDDATREHALPPRTATERVEFVEFAASHAEAEEFGRMFRALGFVPTARHRSKEVVRWQQGAINFVVNSEPEGLAHSFDIVHGGSVCAIGLSVSDQSQVLERAAALDIPLFEQAVGPQEWTIPSVRAVGGSLIYLVDDATSDAMWAQEFPHPLEPAPSSPALVAVDHLAQTMHYEEFLSWLLYYTALFDFTKTPQLEITDPMGIVYSQAVESADRGIRITLNGSSSINTLSNRFVHHYFGAGVQHIALRTDDVFATAERARAAGMPPLEIGANYYDDLEARFDIDHATLERMRALHILYDRDADGEYFQFYSRAVAKRVFFEVVERRGYQAYGAGNASIRLNAQARFREIPGV